MFGRMVKVDDREYFVFCTPETPFSEVLRRASHQAERQEKRQAEERMKSSPYYAALRSNP